MAGIRTRNQPGQQVVRQVYLVAGGLSPDERWIAAFAPSGWTLHKTSHRTSLDICHATRPCSR